MTTSTSKDRSKSIDQKIQQCKKAQKVHGEKGAFVAGHWVDIEDCAEGFEKRSGTSTEDYKKNCKGDCKTCPRSRTRHSSARKDGSYDVIIIGGGCIGAAIMRELSKTKTSVLLLEAADDVTQGATKGNSGIVHAGYDDIPGTVKSKYCWKGNQMFPQLDKELKFGFQLNGSLVVATSEEDLVTLKNLMKRGDENGVKNLKLLNQKELRELEPYIHENAIGALYSPDAGTITPYEYTIALAENAVDNGAEIRIRREVTSIQSIKSETNIPGNFLVSAKHWEPAAVADKFLGKETTPVGGVSQKELKVLSKKLSGDVDDEHVRPDDSNWKIQFLPFAIGALVGGEYYHSNMNNTSVEDISIEQKSLLLSCIVACVLFIVFKIIEYVKNKKNNYDQHSYSPSKGTVLKGLSETEYYTADYIINAAGCKSDKIAQMVGDHSFQIKPRMGEYILLHKDEGYKCTATLFPCPHPVYGKGVLVQGTLWGNLILGPTARDTLIKDKDSGKYVINKQVQNEDVNNIMGYILSKCKNLVPSFDAGKVIHTFSGARAKNTTGDWIIGPYEKDKNFINAAGIDSPGIAASPAIAVDVVRMLKEQGCSSVSMRNPTFNPFRAPIIKVKDGYKNIKINKKQPWKEKDPKKNIICKCEKVTEAEVIDACRRSLPIDSTQAIRKRTRAGMGHCQGDKNNYDCECRVATIISRETGVDIEKVGRRPWPASSMLPERIVEQKTREHLITLSDVNNKFTLSGAAP